MRDKKFIAKIISIIVGIIPFVILKWLVVEPDISYTIYQIVQISSILFFVTSVLIGFYYHKFQLKMVTIFNIILSVTFSYLTIKTFPELIENINIYLFFVLIVFSSILLFIGFCVECFNRTFNV